MFFQNSIRIIVLIFCLLYHQKSSGSVVHHLGWLMQPEPLNQLKKIQKNFGSYVLVGFTEKGSMFDCERPRLPNSYQGVDHLLRRTRKNQNMRPISGLVVHKINLGDLNEQILQFHRNADIFCLTGAITAWKVRNCTLTSAFYLQF